MTRRPAHRFPFSAIVGQDALKLALLLNAVDPRVGGVLIRGEKGTAKSTAVRALVGVLPQIDVIEGCAYGCSPSDPGFWCDDCRSRRDSGPLPKSKRSSRVVDLPVSATEDRLVGTLDFEQALKHGERAFHPGLLAEANRGILYVDEVNLLDDHLVDTLLDAAAMGVNIVEREGVSFAHPARFILVGTMNPEEGEIRPQLIDRFGLCVDVVGVREPEARVEITRRRHAFEEDPTGFARDWADAEDEVRITIDRARLRLPSVQVPDDIHYAIAQLAIRAGVDGHRADSVMVRGACAAASLEGRSHVTLHDVELVAEMALRHRLRSRPFEDVAAEVAGLRDSLSAEEPGVGSAEAAAVSIGDATGSDHTDAFRALSAALSAEQEAVGVAADFETQLDGTRRSIDGRRHRSTTSDNRGRYVRSESTKSGDVSSSDIALDATIRTAARNQMGRRSGDTACVVEPEDLQRKVRVRKVGATIVFCVDASGSMGASKRMEAARSAVLELLVDAYQRRDRVALVSFRGTDAEVLLSPTASVELANLKLKSLATGGATPLAHGLTKALELLESERRREPDLIPWLVLVSDGRANVGLDGGLGSEDARAVASRLKGAGVNVVVIDTAGAGGSNPAREIARSAGAEYVRLSQATGKAMAQAVKERL